MPTANGVYDIEVKTRVRNQTCHWRVVWAKDLLYLHERFDLKAITWEQAPRYIYDRVDRGETKDYIVKVKFEVENLKIGGYIKILFQTNTLWTDINEDRLVDIIDLTAVAKKYGQRYTNLDDSLFIFDVEPNYSIDVKDLVWVGKDFGYTY